MQAVLYEPSCPHTSTSWAATASGLEAASLAWTWRAPRRQRSQSPPNCCCGHTDTEQGTGDHWHCTDLVAALLQQLVHPGGVAHP